MFPSDLSFSKAIMAARQAARSRGSAQRVYRLPATRPSGRPAQAQAQAQEG